MTRYDPGKTSEKRYDAREYDWMFKGGGWMVFVRKKGEADLYHFWPDGQRPEGVFIDEAEMREWVTEAVAEVKRRGHMEVEVIIVYIGPVDFFVASTTPP